MVTAMKRDPQPALKPLKPQRTTINCPVRPEDYNRFKAGAALRGMEVREAFGEASRLWIDLRCPELAGKEAVR